MNYRKIYSDIINNAKARTLPEEVYCERHHIVPKSMGGKDTNDNIVKLTAKEHYICHWLLYKIHRNREMATAWYFMRAHSTANRYTSRTFEYAKKAYIKEQTGRKLTKEHKRKISEAGKGRPTTQRQRDAVIKRNKETEWTDEMRRKASLARKGKFVRGAHQRARKVINKDTNQVFDCMTDAADELGVTKAAIQNAITRGNKCRGFVFAYHDS